jgi:hypothetical protein
MAVPVIAIVRFPVTGTLSADEQRTLFERTSPRYRTIPGLTRKYFIGAAGVGGGVYEWASREDALSFYDAAWRERMRSAYGAEPEIEFFEAPCIVDNEAGVIRMA